MECIKDLTEPAAKRTKGVGSIIIIHLVTTMTRYVQKAKPVGVQPIYIAGVSPQPESLYTIFDVQYIQILRISALDTRKLISMVAMLALMAVAIQGVRRSR